MIFTNLKKQSNHIFYQMSRFRAIVSAYLSNNNFERLFPKENLQIEQYFFHENPISKTNQTL